MEKIILFYFLLSAAVSAVSAEEEQSYVFTVFQEENTGSPVPDYIPVIDAGHPKIGQPFPYQIYESQPVLFHEYPDGYAQKDRAGLEIDKTVRQDTGSLRFSLAFQNDFHFKILFRHNDPGSRFETRGSFTNGHRYLRFNSLIDISPALSLENEYYLLHQSDLSLIHKTGIDLRKNDFTFLLSGYVGIQDPLPLVYGEINPMIGYRKNFLAGVLWQTVSFTHYPGLNFKLDFQPVKMDLDLFMVTDFKTEVQFSFNFDLGFNFSDHFYMKIRRKSDHFYHPDFTDIRLDLDPRLEKSFRDLYLLQFHLIYGNYQFKMTGFAGYDYYQFDFSSNQSFQWQIPFIMAVMNHSYLFRNGQLFSQTTYSLENLKTHEMKVTLAYQDLRIFRIDLSFSQSAGNYRDFNSWITESDIIIGFNPDQKIRYFLSNSLDLQIMFPGSDYPVFPVYSIEAGIRSLW